MGVIHLVIWKLALLVRDHQAPALRSAEMEYWSGGRLAIQEVKQAAMQTVRVQQRDILALEEIQAQIPFALKASYTKAALTELT